jgi:hypothetical protein
MLNSGNKKIWRGLVDYANATDLECKHEALNNLAQTLFECMPWMARTAFDEDVPAMIALQTNREDLFGQVDGKQVWLCFKSKEQLANQFRQQAIEYQPEVRQLLTWLSDRKQNAQERPHAFAFLREHTKHIEFQRGDPAFAPEEEQDRYFTMGGDLKDDFPHRTLSYKDVADVICDFVQKEHEKTCLSKSASGQDAGSWSLSSRNENIAVQPSVTENGKNETMTLSRGRIGTTYSFAG